MVLPGSGIDVLWTILGLIGLALLILGTSWLVVVTVGQSRRLTREHRRSREAQEEAEEEAPPVRPGV